MNTESGTIRIWVAAVVVFLAAAACATLPAQIEPSVQVEQNTDGERDKDSEVDVRYPLSYRGPEELGGHDTSRCAAFSIDGTLEATVIGCDGTTRSEPLGGRTAGEWQEVRARSAPFVYETQTESLVLDGVGVQDMEPWRRAVLAWARGRYAELSTGKTSASLHSTMSWHLGQDYTQKNICMHLSVLDYGFAYAEEILCEGLDLVSVAQDWLTAEELADLDRWLYERAPLYVEKNYVAGSGQQEVTAGEIEDVERWAAGVWSRIRETGAIAPAQTASVCPDARDDLGMVRDYRKGICLLVPSTHTVFEPNPDEIVIARDSMLNVTEPRVYIVVTDAGGRSADEIADAVTADFPGFDIARRSEHITGRQAVILDNVPGQDLNRRVLIVHNDRLYDLTFAPSDHAQMETFYSAVVGDLTLVEPN